RGIFGTIPMESESAELPGGDTLVAVHAGSQPTIVVLRVNAGGTIVWNEDVASIRTTPYKSNVRLLAAGDGGGLVPLTQGTPTGLYARRLSRSGVAEWTTQASDGDVRYQDPSVLEDGSLLVALSTFSAVQMVRLRGDGRFAWPQHAVALADRSSAHNPVSLAVL